MVLESQIPSSCPPANTVTLTSPFSRRSNTPRALPSIILLLGGVQWGWGNLATACGAGIAAYGAIYLGFHDIIVHQRVKNRYVARSPYMKRIVQAHRLHHVVETKEGTVSFGFLVAPRPEDLKRELASRNRAGVRTASGAAKGG